MKFLFQLKEKAQNFTANNLPVRLLCDSIRICQAILIIHVINGFVCHKNHYAKI